MPPELQYVRGILGQGCYLRQTVSKPGLLQCRLPALLVLQLMDFGRWQLLGHADEVYIPDSLKSEKNQIDSLCRKINDARARINTGTAGPANDNPDLTMGLLPLNLLVDAHWRADQLALEHAITRLESDPADALKKRLSRILYTLLDQSPETTHSDHSR